MLKELIDDLIKNLDSRQRDIIVGRFGLKGRKTTLAAIGKKYNLTRERIRQIEASSLDLMRNKNKNGPLAEFVKKCVEYLGKMGGVKKENEFIDEIRVLFRDKNINHLQLRFVFEIFGEPKFYRADKEFHNFWHLNGKAFSQAADFIDKLAKTLGDKKEEILKKKNFKEIFSSAIKSRGVKESAALNYLEISKKFKASPFGDFGLSSWEEINPKTIRAKTYLILKKRRQPLHFKKIAEEINKVNFGKRTALPQTVHNELIKDPRFILVGRGMYGLAEHGFRPGTAKEVIARILKEKGPLSKKEVVNLVSQERFIKENTILLNLQNRRHFKKLPNGKYHIA